MIRTQGLRRNTYKRMSLTSCRHFHLTKIRCSAKIAFSADLGSADSPARQMRVCPNFISPGYKASNPIEVRFGVYEKKYLKLLVRCATSLKCPSARRSPARSRNLFGGSPAYMQAGVSCVRLGYAVGDSPRESHRSAGASQVNSSICGAERAEPIKDAPGKWPQSA